MSYDIHLFRPRPGADPLDTAREDLDDEEDPGAGLSPEATAGNQRILARIREVEPGIEVHASRSWVELTWEADDAAFQLFLGARSGALNVPYWNPNLRPEVQRRILLWMRIAREECGWQAYDPQLDALVPLAGERILDPRSFEQATAVLGGRRARKPWWKFW